jgi:hypothetical protein
LATHWFPAVQAAPLAPAQVLLLLLQAELTQTALAFEGEQAPLWSPSLGMAAPAPSLVAQVNVPRLQYWPLAHSPST